MAAMILQQVITTCTGKEYSNRSCGCIQARKYTTIAVILCICPHHCALFAYPFESVTINLVLK